MQNSAESDDSHELVDLSNPGSNTNAEAGIQADTDDKISIQSDRSEYETGSEWNPDFQSDNEPPQDQIQEERLIIKNPSLRIFKKIVRLGQRGDMPSKYNIIKYRLVEKEEESLES